MADNVEDKLEESALGPKRVRGDAGEVEQHGLKELIELDKHQNRKSALQRRFGFFAMKLVPPGSV